ncbi:MAG: [FeFe] hydrogenase H-cluster radical SAM maturase HydE [candidate division WOR-3 bacterium]|nr:[FeFe] hydrogenase H-cluster radical SAM maturase HydE [candidate division WOR-3 bacterium]
MQGTGIRLPAGKEEMIPQSLTRDVVLWWLRENDETKLETLWQEADRTRKEYVGDAVHLRGLIEMSSFCRRDCHYCGIRGSRQIDRYRLSEAEVEECVRLGVRLGYGTVVLQAGEDPGLSRERITRHIRFIKSETPLAATLSLGERSDAELAEWREAGADRYLLRYETSDMALFRRIHPDCGTEVSDRIEFLRRLKRLGYEAGSGVMVGIPGQSFETLADDILLFRELDLDMVGVGPYLAHPDTPLGRAAAPLSLPPREQVPATDVMTTKTIALTRLVCPDVNIPSTTALATVNTENGRELGLERGANVWMPNLTPTRYRALYEIYPDKACAGDTAEECQACLLRRIASLGRVPGTGPGGRVRTADSRSNAR